MTELKKIVILAEDDLDYMEQMTASLEELGFEVVSADSQKAAEELIKTVKPDLAVFDLMMENQDSGFILSHKIKKLYPTVPVIIATAVSAETGLLFNVETEQDKNWLGADLILEKGIRQDQLHREISKLLKI
jgi:DNA-binding response OmpR family regulator